MWRENQMTDGIKWIYSHKYIVYRRPMAKLAHNAWHHDRDDVVCHLYLRWRVNEFRTSRRREFRRWIYRIYIANEVQIVLRWLAGVSPSLNHPKKRSDKVKTLISQLFEWRVTNELVRKFSLNHFFLHQRPSEMEFGCAKPRARNRCENVLNFISIAFAVATEIKYSMKVDWNRRRNMYDYIWDYVRDKW